ncbi:MAG: hypothetical protein IJB65_01085 [Clostridia bacterium]|nr:hypothetical protein [Clostridia bacterium]
MRALFIDILNLSIVSSWLILAVLALRLVLKRVAPRWTVCLLWGLVAISLIVPFSFESPVSLVPNREAVVYTGAEEAPKAEEPKEEAPTVTVPQSPVVSAPAIPVIRPNKLQVQSGITSLDDSINKVVSPKPEEAANSVDRGTLAVELGGYIWVAGTVFLLAYFVISLALLKRSLSTAVSESKGVYRGDRVGSPFVLGFISPKVYLPFGLSEENQSYVLRHEHAHIKRLDHLVKPLAFFILALHWFNPLVWVSYILLCRDIEYACDEKVIKELNTEERKAYATALLACGVKGRSAMSCPVAFGEISVKQRIKKALSYKKPALWIIIAVIVTAAVLALCFLSTPEKKTEGGIEKSSEESTEEESTGVSSGEESAEEESSEVSTEEEQKDIFPVPTGGKYLIGLWATYENGAAQNIGYMFKEDGTGYVINIYTEQVVEQFEWFVDKTSPNKLNFAVELEEGDGAEPFATTQCDYNINDGILSMRFLWDNDYKSHVKLMSVDEPLLGTWRLEDDTEGFKSIRFRLNGTGTITTNDAEYAFGWHRYDETNEKKLLIDIVEPVEISSDWAFAVECTVEGDSLTLRFNKGGEYICTKETENLTSLIGSWIYDDGSGDLQELLLNEDGTGKVIRDAKEQAVTWLAKEGYFTLYIAESGKLSFHGEYYIDGDCLYLEYAYALACYVRKDSALSSYVVDISSFDHAVQADNADINCDWGGTEYIIIRSSADLANFRFAKTYGSFRGDPCEINGAPYEYGTLPARKTFIAKTVTGELVSDHCILFTDPNGKEQCFKIWYNFDPTGTITSMPSTSYSFEYASLVK